MKCKFSLIVCEDPVSIGMMSLRVHGMHRQIFSDLSLASAAGRYRAGGDYLCVDMDPVARWTAGANH